VIGTPVYMPPEQAEGRVGEVDERSDVYALGAILYEVLTLQPPVETRGGALVVIGRVSRGEVIAPEQRAPDRAREGKIPKELSAIAMKALSLKMEDRYGSAEEFRRDIELYLEGRAVSAKEDTFAESVAKLVKRNKTASVVAAAATAIIAAIVGTAFWLNLQEKRAAVAAQARAEDALAERDKEQARRQAGEAARRAEQRKSVPAFMNAARLSANQKNFEDALAQVAVALEYAPDFAEARLFKAQLHIVQDEYPAAVEELDRYLKDRPDDKDAAELRELSARAVTEKNLDPRFAAVFERQKAWAFSERKVRTLDRLLPLCNKRLQESWPGVSLRLNNEGSATLEWGRFNTKAVHDLSPLAGMPVSVLSLLGTSVTDLSPLQGMPLTSLDLCQCNGIKDLSPLKGMPLAWLNLTNCEQVKDLTPLKGMPLTWLRLEGCGHISDLTPLGGMPLTWLRLSGCGQVRDLTPLTGMPLTELCLDGASVTDLTPLKDMPLILLNCGQVSDLTPLKGLKLGKLVFSPKTVRQGMEVIRDMKSLRTIDTGPGKELPAAEFWKKYDAGEFNK
jgi:tetratricopeptide (TPR) repeat protein